MCNLEKFANLPDPVTLLTANTIMPFGKYKHRKVTYVLDENPSYLLWVNDNAAGYKLSLQVFTKATIEAAKRKTIIWDNWNDDEFEDCFDQPF